MLNGEFLLFVCFLKMDLVCSSRWPGTCRDSPAFTSLVLGLKVSTTMLYLDGFIYLNFRLLTSLRKPQKLEILEIINLQIKTNKQAG